MTLWKHLQHRDFTHKLCIPLSISTINRYSHPIFIGKLSFETVIIPLIKKVKKRQKSRFLSELY